MRKFTQDSQLVDYVNSRIGDPDAADEVIIMDGFPGEAVGLFYDEEMDRWRLVYCRERIIGALMGRNRWDRGSAEEWLEFNIVRGIPPGGPIIIESIT